MSSKRSNNSVWKLLLPADTLPSTLVDAVVTAYGAQVDHESGKQELIPVPLDQPIPGVRLDLYVRNSYSTGLLPLVRAYLCRKDDAAILHVKGADALLFLSTESNVFVVTSGAAYRIIADFVDYHFPFETAKKLISNNFTAADVRDMTGSTLTRSATYRRVYSIEKSEAMDTIWKKLVGRLDTERINGDNILSEIVNLDRPPAVEIKSAFVLRQRMDLAGICKLIQCLESLPEPSEEYRRELAFLDNLYPIRNEKELAKNLTREFIDSIRRELLGAETPDLDVLDPYEVTTFTAGVDFRLGGTALGDYAPGIDDLTPLLMADLGAYLEDPQRFCNEFLKLTLSYQIDPDDTSKRIRHKLLDFLHGQVDLADATYFRIDKVWYRSLGDFLENLRNDFIDDVFKSGNPISLGSEVEFLRWTDGDEHSFNELQATEADFYFGDEVFAKARGGKVELFDLLKVDEAGGKVYVIHTKKGFGVKMRDACSQIRISADTIEGDLDNGKKVLSKYYQEEWSKVTSNSSTDEATFLSWFDLRRVYVVLCSTGYTFDAPDFVRNRLRSHIARREVLATRNELKGRGRQFRLAHTRNGSDL
ncbi:DUF6119 family protein [Nocardia sp. NPDC052566]|uniref:DUF6119 family protein n=1 Tax=Nocardia sp. NPDC052566 TaxID=3364330 RepID=UPI0037C9F943